MKKIRWGIVGPGNIAAKFTNDLKLVDDAAIIGVASRNIERAEEFAHIHNVERAFESYDELFKSDSVDVIYIATPHVFHKNLALTAMAHGKHVLCEKPMGINADEVEAMVACSKKNNVFLMEALWSRFNPAIVAAKQKIDDGQLGELQYINADFAFYAMDRNKESRLLNPKLAGGSLLDIGIYPVFLTYLLLGMPNSICVEAKLREDGLETQLSMIFVYQHAHAILNSSFEYNSRMSAEIAGKLGNIFLAPRWHEANGYTFESDGDQEKFATPKQGNGYTHEIVEVHNCLTRGVIESDLWSHQNSLELISLLDSIRGKAGIKFPSETS